MFVLFLLSIVGCGQIGGEGTAPRTEEVYKGTKGIEMSFVPSNPPNEVFEGSPMTVLIEYSNKGANPISDGSLYLTGYDPAFLFRNSGGYQEWSLRGLQGKSLLNPVGEEKLAEFTDNDIRKPDNIDRFAQKLKLTACYNYMTTASAQVCIDPDPYNLGGGTKTCTVGIVSLSGGQGAPVAVTKIDERIAGNRVQFKIYFKNVGGGEVFIGPTSHCYSNLQYDDMNKVVVDRVSFSNRNINCEPEYGTPIRLNNGEGFVICYDEGHLGDGDEYITTLNIKLKYSYRDSIVKSIDILDIPGVPGPGGTTPSSPGGGGSDTDCGSKGCCTRDLGGYCLKNCDNACPGQRPCPAGYCSGGTSRKCCITSGDSSGSGTCGSMCAAAVGHADAPWCYCSRTGSCPSGYRPIGSSSDGCNPCCAKS